MGLFYFYKGTLQLLSTKSITLKQPAKNLKNNRSDPENFADLHDDREREPQPVRDRDLSHLLPGIKTRHPSASEGSDQFLEASKSVLKTAKIYYNGFIR